jgi:replicative DNA helicase
MVSSNWIEKRKECEEGLAVAAATDPVLLTELSTMVSESDFREPFLGKWFSLACELNESQSFELGKLRGELQSRGFLESITELSDWVRLTRTFIGAGTARYYASELARLTALESIERLLRTHVLHCDEIASDPVEIARSLTSQLEAVHARNSRLWETSTEVAERVYRNHKTAVDECNGQGLGIPTGYFCIDEVTGGFFRGQLWQIAARSYMGKSTVALAFAQQQLDRGNGVYFASYEMTNDELMERIYSDRTGTPLRKFTQGRLERTELQAVLCESQEIGSKPFCMDDRPPDSVSGLKARVKLASNAFRIDLVVVDHLLLFPYKDRRVPRHQQLVEITRELKQMAKECGVVVLLLNQLNADADGEEPSDKHFSESKAILQNLDVSILLHRDTKSSEEMKLKITKNRKGAPGEILMKFLGAVQRFEEYAPEPHEDFRNYAN